jgi:hypothetical protein
MATAVCRRAPTHPQFRRSADGFVESSRRTHQKRTGSDLDFLIQVLPAQKIEI